MIQIKIMLTNKIKKIIIIANNQPGNRGLKVLKNNCNNNQSNNLPGNKEHKMPKNSSNKETNSNNRNNNNHLGNKGLKMPKNS